MLKLHKKSLVPTERGFKAYSSLTRISAITHFPELTGEWEYKLNQVDSLSRREFMKQIEQAVLRACIICTIGRTNS